MFHPQFGGVNLRFFTLLPLHVARARVCHFFTASILRLFHILLFSCLLADIRLPSLSLFLFSPPLQELVCRAVRVPLLGILTFPSDILPDSRVISLSVYEAHSTLPPFV